MRDAEMLLSAAARTFDARTQPSGHLARLVREDIRGHQRSSSCNQTPSTKERRVDEEPGARAQTACVGHALLKIAREAVAEQADEQ